MLTGDSIVSPQSFPIKVLLTDSVDTSSYGPQSIQSCVFFFWFFSFHDPVEEFVLLLFFVEMLSLYPPCVICQVRRHSESVTFA